MRPWMHVALLATALIAGPATACDYADVVRRYEAWRGGEPFKQVRSVRLQGTLATGGLTGTEAMLVDDTGRARLDIALGPLIQHQVATPTSTWEVTPAGQVQSMALVDALSIQRRQLLLLDIFAGRHGEKSTLLGCSTSNDRERAEVRISYGDDDTYDALIDVDSGALTGFRVVEERQARTESFDDWRFVDGVRMPFVRDIASDVESDAESLHVTSLEIDPAIADTSFTRPAARRLARFVDDKKSTGWIDFTYYAGNRIFFPARINGHTAMVLLDSGATVSTADVAFAKRIGLQPLGTLSAGGSGGIGTAGFAGGVDVEVGALRIAGLTVATIDLTSVARRIGQPLPFVLGDEAFNELIVELDAAHHRIAFRDPDTLKVPKGAVTVPLHRLIGNRSVPVAVEGGDALDFEFDLGNGSPLEIYPALHQKRDLIGDKRSSQILAGGVGGDHPETVVTLATVRFAGTDFHAVPADLTRDVPSAANSNRVVGNIGLPILARFRLWIDYAHDRLFAVPNAGAAKTAFKRDRLGLTLSKERDCLLVQFVSPHGPADAAGLRATDRVAAIAGRSAASWSDAQLAALRQTPGKAAVRFTLADGSHRIVHPARFY